MQDEYKRTDKINRVCITCGSKFIVQFQAVESGGGLFCSRNCNPKIVESNSKKVKNKLGKTNDIVEQNCVVCNEPFKTKVKNIARGGGRWCSKICSKAHIKKPKEHHRLRERERHLKNTYNLTITQYNKLLDKQNGVCAICEEPPKGKGSRSKYLYVDHDHTTNIVRGLLCRNCNVAIGFLSDSKKLLQKAIQYLNK